MDTKRTDIVKQDGLLVAEAEPDFEILTTMRWIPGRVRHIEVVANGGSNDINQAVRIHPNDLITYHLQRLKNAAKACGFDEAYNVLQGTADKTGVELLLDAIDNAVGVEAGEGMWDAHLVRITIDKTGHIHATSSLLVGKDDFVLVPRQYHTRFFHRNPTEVPNCTVFLDRNPTPPSIYTTHKTTHRPMYVRARANCNIQDKPPKDFEVLLQNEHGEIMEASVSTAYFCRGGHWVTPAASCGGNLGVTRQFAIKYGRVREEIVLASSLKDEIIWLSNAVRGYWRAKVMLG